MSTDHNFGRERRTKADSNRGPSAYQPNALPLGQTGSRQLVHLFSIQLTYMTHSSMPTFSWTIPRLCRHTRHGNSGAGSGSPRPAGGVRFHQPGHRRLRRDHRCQRNPGEKIKGCRGRLGLPRGAAKSIRWRLRCYGADTKIVELLVSLTGVRKGQYLLCDVRDSPELVSHLSDHLQPWTIPKEHSTHEVKSTRYPKNILHMRAGQQGTQRTYYT